MRIDAIRCWFSYTVTHKAIVVFEDRVVGVSYGGCLVGVGGVVVAELARKDPIDNGTPLVGVVSPELRGTLEPDCTVLDPALSG